MGKEYQDFEEDEENTLRERLIKYKNDLLEKGKIYGNTYYIEIAIEIEREVL